MLIRAATTADAMGLAKVHVDTWKATYRGMVPNSFLDGLAYDRSTRGWEKALGAGGIQRVLVAEDEMGSIVGFASGGPNRDTDTPSKGELYAMYILPGQQQQGLGKDLLRRFANAMIADGLDSLTAWVLTANAPARRFYEAMGGTLAAQRQVEIGGQPLDEVAYAWASLSACCTPHQGFSQG